MIKPVVGFVGLSSASVGGVLLYRSLSPSQEKPLMSSIDALMFKKHKGKRLISTSLTGNDSYWKAGWKAYLEANKESNPWNVSGWSKNKEATGTEDAPADFIDACKVNSKKEVSGEKDALYLQVLSYCTRNTMVSDLISENASGRVLMTKVTGTSDSNWNLAWKDYQSKNKVKTTGNDAWKLDNWQSQHASENALESLMDKCAEKAKTETWDISSTIYQQVVDWCTKGNSQQQTE